MTGSGTEDQRQRAPFEPLMTYDVDVSFFMADWSHCDKVSTYLARSVSHTRSDSLLHANLLSSALNELMETIFRVNARTGTMACKVSRSGVIDRVEVFVPCDDETMRFYEDALDRVRGEDAMVVYMDALFAQGPLATDIGLLELALDYKAEMSLRRVDDRTLCLMADFALESNG